MLHNRTPPGEVLLAQYAGAYHGAHKVEVADHCDDVGGLPLLGLLHPSLAETFPGVDGKPQIEIDNRHLARELDRVNIRQGES